MSEIAAVSRTSTVTAVQHLVLLRMIQCWLVIPECTELASMLLSLAPPIPTRDHQLSVDPLIPSP